IAVHCMNPVFMSRAKNITLNFLSLLGGDILVKAFGVISTAILARSIGPSRFGLLNLCLVAVNYFGLMATWGMPAIGVREISVHKESARSWAAYVTRLRLFLAFGAYALLYLWTRVHVMASDSRLITLGFGLTILTTVCLMDWPLQGLEEMRSIGAIRVAGAVIYLAGILLFIHAQA